MTSDLYWVSSITYIIVLVVILANDVLSREGKSEVEKAFQKMVSWVIFFCAQDTVWGLCDAKVIKSSTVFYWSSIVFHASTVVTTFFWLDYVLIYLGDRIKKRKIYLVLDGFVIVFEFILVIRNFFTVTLFEIVDGRYVIGPFRSFTFINQYVIYLTIGVLTFIFALKAEGKNKDRYWSVFMFALAPIVLCVLQLLYPDAPFYSLGYFLGCFIIHIFVVAKDHEDLVHMDLILKSNSDELTGLLNRRAFEEDLFENGNLLVNDNLVFVSMDVNGLKVTNDTLGHEAGDELLVGASRCMKECLQPFGKVYRTGGDEFAALLYVPENELDDMKNRFETSLINFEGKYVTGITVSCGYVLKSEIENYNMHEVSVLADKRMYESKAAYYRRKGVDRRGQQEAHTALCALYTKIVKINITDDTYKIINMNYAAGGTEDVTKLPHTISGWLTEFGNSGAVHSDDLEDYFAKTNIDYLRNYFKRNKKSLIVRYRRKCGRKYNNVMMEFIPTSEYTKDNQTLFMYVKNIG